MYEKLLYGNLIVIFLKINIKTNYLNLYVNINIFLICINYKEFINLQSHPVIR